LGTDVAVVVEHVDGGGGVLRGGEPPARKLHVRGADREIGDVLAK